MRSNILIPITHKRIHFILQVTTKIIFFLISEKNNFTENKRLDLIIVQDTFIKESVTTQHNTICHISEMCVESIRINSTVGNFKALTAFGRGPYKFKQRRYRSGDLILLNMQLTISKVRGSSSTHVLNGIFA